MPASPKQPLVIILIACLLLSSCRLNKRADNNSNPNGTELPAEETSAPTTTAPTSVPEPTIQILQYTTGRNEYIIDVDDTPREFILYVPGGYDPNTPIPVVVMAHGSNQKPQTMYENTGWVAKAEQETILIVFPGGWEYPLVGEGGVHEKWNTPGTATEVVPGTELKDDVKFIRTILDDLKATFHVDEKRIYASGFSNGGGFVLTRLIPYMNDVFAAYSTGGAGLIGEATTEDLPVQISVPLYSVLGTNDNKLSEGQGIPIPFPFTEDELVNDPVFYGMLEKTATFLNLGMTYTVESDQAFTRLTFADSTTSVNNEYLFMMIRGMGHVYPSGDNNRAGVNAADLFWDFFLKHPKP